MKLKLLIALTLILFSPLVAVAADGVITDVSKVCMMQDSLMEKPGILIEHQGKNYYGCCAMCSKAIAQDPEKYTKTKDPVSKTTVDKAEAYIYALGGKAFYFESEANRRHFEKEPARYLVNSGH